jgi:hypothetical protein
VETNDMKYMLLMQGSQAGWQTFNEMPLDDIEAHIGFMKRLNAELTESGELVDAQGLAFPDQAKVVRSQPGGAPAVTDGPFPESKEFLAGYWIVDCESIDRAIEIAVRASAAPGRGGKPIGIPIEVRQVMSAPPVEA